MKHLALLTAVVLLIGFAVTMSVISKSAPATQATVITPVEAALPVPLPFPSMAQRPQVDDAIRLARERLGKMLFFDTTLSEPHGTSCSSCHEPSRAFSGNHGSTMGVPLGSTAGSYGLRNAPLLTYAGYIPPFTTDKEDDPLEPHGGLFLDGRAAFMDAQAEGPLLSPLEMNNHDHAQVVAKMHAGYAQDFKAAFGADIFSHGTDWAFDALGAALQAFEKTAPFHPFSSRFDRWRAGTLTLSAAESHGLTLFLTPNKGNCVTCHLFRSQPQFAKVVPFFTDFGYETLGVPRNQAIPANGDPAFYDLGLGGPKRTVPRGDPTFYGAFRTPGLRNVAVKQAFMHNGIFKRLEDVVSFYATRDTSPERWYPRGAKFNDTPAIYQQYINTGAPFGGHPGEAPHLSPQEIVDLVIFLRALTDQEFEAALPPPPSVETLGMAFPDPASPSPAAAAPGVPSPAPAVSSGAAAAAH